jgi:ribosome-binding protein aMBF1 (putative translation factor)
MSDLYLILRSRLSDVAEWVELGEEVMRSARHARGLSMESVARTLHESHKTYERHEKAGRVPKHRVSDYARVLGLEIVEPERQSVSLSADEATLGEILAETRRQSGLLEQIAAAVGGEDQEPPARLRRAQGGSR